jgi:dihydrofolate synthase/folylpolyglutamate synthase
MSTPAAKNAADQYEQTYAFLSSLERFGILFGLDNIRDLLNKLGNPQRSFPVVHVGGSNGKGSTASVICGILSAAGFRPALYTSPHLNDFRERIRINGAMVSREEVIESTRKIRQLYNPERTTFFEFTTAVAFDCIGRARPDIAVIEVGLGGRLDATNVVDPLVTVITDISREHEDYLGAGIESVAREKAGIIKSGVPLISGATRKAAREVIHEAARKAGAPVKQFGRDFAGVRSTGEMFTYRSDEMVLEDLTLSMAGGHQAKNAAMACAVVEALTDQGFEVPEKAFREGVQRTRFPGRFELVGRSPDVVIDGAHTPESMRLLKNSVRIRYPAARPFVLAGMLREKRWQEMARILAPMAREVMCVPPQGDRALQPEELASYVSGLGVPASASESITDGFQILLQKADRHDLILAAGSLYMIGPVRRACGLSDS